MLFIDSKDHVYCILPCSLSVSHQFVRLFVDSLIRLSIHSRFRFSFHCTLFILSQSVIPQYVCLFVHSFTQDLSSGSICTLSFCHSFIPLFFSLVYSFIRSLFHALFFLFFLFFSRPLARSLLYFFAYACICVFFLFCFYSDSLSQFPPLVCSDSPSQFPLILVVTVCLSFHQLFAVTACLILQFLAALFMLIA